MVYCISFPFVPQDKYSVQSARFYLKTGIDPRKLEEKYSNCSLAHLESHKIGTIHDANLNLDFAEIMEIDKRNELD